MRLIDADNLRGRVCEIFLCAEPDSAEERRFALVLGLIDSELTIAPPPNEPLTLEELWEMDGEPVYVRYPRGGGEWGIVTTMYGYDLVGITFNGRCRSVGRKYGLLSMGESIYRRKPEEG